jgi:hypothetical protein
MQRTIGLTLLGALAAVLGVLHAIEVFLYTGVLVSAWASGYSFFGLGILGAILTGVVAWIWFWAAGGLWRNDPSAWLFVVVVAVMTLVFDLLSYVDGTPFAAMAPSVILSAIALVLALLPSTREALPKQVPV